MRKLSRAYLIKAAVLVIALSVFVYAPSLRNSFVGDDAAVIIGNDFIKDCGNLRLIFSRAYLTSEKELELSGPQSAGSGEVSYRPVVTLSYFADYRLWKLDPFGFHLTNLLLHITNTLLIFLLAILITARPATALTAALLFAVHPVNSEAINAICFREDLLVFAFFVSAFICYIISLRSAGKKSIGLYGLSLVMFFLALFSKEMAVTLPLILILYDRYFPGADDHGLRRVNSKLRYCGYFVILIFYLLVWGVIFKNPNPAAGYPGGSFYANIMTVSAVIAGYIKQAVVPLKLHFMVTEPHLVIRHFNVKVLFSFFLFAACVIAAVKLRKSAKEASFSIAWFFVTLLPVMNIFPLKHIVGLRYLYLPMAGFCIFLAVALQRITGRSSRIVLAVILVFYSAVSMARITVWKDNISLWSEIARQYPDNHFAHFGLGEVFLQSGQQDKAMREFKMSLRLNPRNAGAYYQLAGLYTAAGRQLDAQQAYQEAIALSPGYLKAYNDLAALYAENNRIDEAILLWNKAVSIDKGFLLAHFNLVVFYFQKGEYAAAIEHADAVTRAGAVIDPALMQLLKPHRKSGS